MPACLLFCLQQQLGDAGLHETQEGVSSIQSLFCHCISRAGDVLDTSKNYCLSVIFQDEYFEDEGGDPWWSRVADFRWPMCT